MKGSWCRGREVGRGALLKLMVEPQLWRAQILEQFMGYGVVYEWYKSVKLSTLVAACKTL